MGNPVVHWELMPKQHLRLEGDAPPGDRLPRRRDAGDREGPWPGNMLFYILVDDLSAYRKKVVAAGGKIHIEEQKVPGMGKFALFTDPEGRTMGVWKARQR